jgi:hypothetical protein
MSPQSYRGKRRATIYIVLAIVGVIGIIVWKHSNFPTALVVSATVAFLFFAQAYASFDPTTIAVPTYRNELVNMVMSGWQIFPFKGFLFGYRVLTAERINWEDTATERTPDKGLTKVQPFAIWRISRTNPIAFILNGGQAAIEKMFAERTLGRLREWITSAREGPQTWEEALKSNGAALYVLTQKLFQGSIPPIPEQIYLATPDLRNIPEIGFVRYFVGRPPLLEDPKTAVGKEEMDWKTTLDQLRKDNPRTWEMLRVAVEAQLQFVERMKSGGVVNGQQVVFPIHDLGIEILLLGIAGISATGATADAADNVSTASQKAQVNNIDAENFRQEVANMLPLVGNNHKLAVEAVQLRRGLIKKDVDERNYGLSSETINNIDAFARWFVENHGRRII